MNPFEETANENPAEEVEKHKHEPDKPGSKEEDAIDLN
jgi:hypothetical protein